MSRYRRTDRGFLLPGVFAFASAVDSPTNTKLQLAALSKENFDRPHRYDRHHCTAIAAVYLESRSWKKTAIIAGLIACYILMRCEQSRRKKKH